MHILQWITLFETGEFIESSKTPPLYCKREVNVYHFRKFNYNINPISHKWLTLPRPCNMVEKPWSFGIVVAMVANWKDTKEKVESPRPGIPVPPPGLLSNFSFWKAMEIFGRRGSDGGALKNIQEKSKAQDPVWLTNSCCQWQMAALLWVELLKPVVETAVVLTQSSAAEERYSD